ncbi:MAG: hypothetical protein AABX48_04895, partial [Nanoarchaeota archaeon]
AGNISIAPVASQWFYNQTAGMTTKAFVSTSINANLTDFYTLNSTFWYNQTLNIYYYNQTLSPYYYNQTLSPYYYNQTIFYTNGTYINKTGTTFDLPIAVTQWLYNQTLNIYYYNQSVGYVLKTYVNTAVTANATTIYTNWTDLRSYTSSSLNANLTSFYTLNSTFWYNQTLSIYYYNQTLSPFYYNQTDVTKAYVNTAINTNTSIKANLTGNVFSGTQEINGLLNVSGVNNLSLGGGRANWNGSCTIISGATSKLELC